jgi:predicted dehydrogenase
MNRRNFITKAGLAGLAYTTIPSQIYSETRVRLGFIGLGARGQSQLDECCKRSDVDVIAIADPDKTWARSEAQNILKQYKRPAAAEYMDGEYDYLNLLKRPDIDAVFICTPWEWHVPQGIAAMKAGKKVAMEVSGAMDIEECWNIVDTFEETGVPLMMMENVNYRRDVMAVMNMVKQGVFGELLHLQGGYQHDLRGVKLNDGKSPYGKGVEFGEKGFSESKWRTLHSQYRNGELYPTHGLGPVATMLDINRGNRLLSLNSVATKSRGLHNYIVANSGADHPNAAVDFKLGDIVTTILTTSNGETIMLSHDTNSPRPYSLNFRVQGTKGIWMDDIQKLLIEGSTPDHYWTDDKEWMVKYDHPLWKKYSKEAENAGHGGMDFFVINAFIECVKRNEPFPLDVYDMATWYAITPLSEISVSRGGERMEIPDFTRGKWINRGPVFIERSEY